MAHELGPVKSEYVVAPGADVGEEVVEILVAVRLYADPNDRSPCERVKVLSPSRPDNDRIPHEGILRTGRDGRRAVHRMRSVLSGPR